MRTEAEPRLVLNNLQYNELPNQIPTRECQGRARQNLAFLDIQRTKLPKHKRLPHLAEACLHDLEASHEEAGSLDAR